MYLVKASGIYYERVGKSVISVFQEPISGFRVFKRPKRANRKRSGFVIYSHFEDSTLFLQSKGMKNSKQGIGKRYHLSIKGIRKGYLCCQKWDIKGKGWDLGVEPSCIKL